VIASRRGLLALGAGGIGAGAGLAYGRAAAEERPPVPTARRLSAADFGAVGDGRADDTEPLQKALDAAFLGGAPSLLTVPPGIYRVTRPLRLELTRENAGKLTRRNGVLAHGATIWSHIEDDAPVLTIESRTVARYPLIEGLQIQGRGKEGHGLFILCRRRGSYFYNFCLRDVTVQGCGGDGCRMVGNVFEGQLINCYFRDNGRNGATFAHGEEDTVLSAVHVVGSVFGGNGRHGAALLDGAADVGFHGCYFLLNRAFGLVATVGCGLLSHCGFENNHAGAQDFERGDAGALIKVGGTLVGCTAYSIYNQTHLIRAFVTNELTLLGCHADGGGRAKKARLAKLAGPAGGQATAIGCRGGIDAEAPLEPIEIGNAGGGVRLGGRWDSPALPRLGEHSLWVDGEGRLRIKRGRPERDNDGSPVG